MSESNAATQTHAQPEFTPDIYRRADLIRSVGIENIGDSNSNLEKLLAAKPEVVAYDGFEPSGRMHIAQGLIRAINTNKMTKAGCKFKFWVADWFATMNLKMGGDAKMIRKAGELMIHTWRASGMDLSNVEFIWASEEIAKRPVDYFTLILDIATKFSLKRILKCGQIMGRKDLTDLDDDGMAAKIDLDTIMTSLKTSQVFYPVMQCADVFFLNNNRGVDICSLGLDQRKVNALALEYCDKIRRKFKPIIISHSMLMGLDGSDKMSKSNPDSAIFMDDSASEVRRKIRKAFCEPSNIKVNPILEYFRSIVFQIEDTSTDSVKVPKYEGGSKQNAVPYPYKKFEDLEYAFETGFHYPNELKDALEGYLNLYLNPVREYFAQNPEAAKLSAEVKRYTEKLKAKADTE